jgi:hypothetical protein
LLHKIFCLVRLDLELKDRFGFQVEPQEWFLAPLPVIGEAINRIINGTIGTYTYDPNTARLIEHASSEKTQVKKAYRQGAIPFGGATFGR